MTEATRNEATHLDPLRAGAAATGVALLVARVGMVGVRNRDTGCLAVLLEVSEVKFETFTTPCKEVFVEHGEMSVTVNTWSNGEGLTFIVTGKNSAIRTAACMRWEELDVLLCALTAARAA